MSTAEFSNDQLHVLVASLKLFQQSVDDMADYGFEPDEAQECLEAYQAETAQTQALIQKIELAINVPF